MTTRRQIIVKDSSFLVWDTPPAENYSDVSAMFAHLDGLGIDQDAVIVDAGANIGVYALGYARLYTRAEIYAFEPNPETFESLVANIELNEQLRDRIHPVNVGLFNVERSMTLSIPTPAVHPRYDPASHQLNSGLFSVYGDGAGQVICDFKSLDSFMPNLPRLDFLKIDVEGSEYEVLDGARSTVDRCRPIVSFEYNELTRTLSRHGSRVFESYFQARRYALFGLPYGWGATLVPLPGLDERADVSDVVCVPHERLGPSVMGVSRL